MNEWKTLVYVYLNRKMILRLACNENFPGEYTYEQICESVSDELHKFGAKLTDNHRVFIAYERS